MTLSKLAERLKPASALFSDEGRTRKAYLNALASALDYGAGLAVGFVTTPWMVAGLGDYYYGVWQVLNRLVGYISPASGKPTLALRWTLANQQASTDYDLKRCQVGNSIIVWLLFLPIMGVAGATIAWFSPYWLGAPAASFPQVRATAGLLAADLAMIALSALPRSVLQGENQGYRCMGLSTLLVFVGGGLTLLALYLKTGLAGVAASALAATLLTGLLFLFAAHRYVPWFGVTRPSWQAIRHFLGLSWWYMAWDMVLTLTMASDVVLLGLLNSVESVTSYTLTKYAPEMLISVVAIIVFGIIPGLGGIIGAGDLQKAARVRAEVMSLTWLVITGLGCSILLWNRSFLGLWVGAGRYAGEFPALLIVAAVAQFVLIRTDSSIIDLTLRPQQKVLLGGLSVALSVGCAGALVGFLKLGVVGLSLGLIAGRSILSVGYPLFIGRFLGISLRSQLRSACRPATLMVLLFALATGLCHLLPEGALAGPTGWVVFFVSACATCGLTIVVAFFAGLPHTQQSAIWQRIRMVAAIQRRGAE